MKVLYLTALLEYPNSTEKSEYEPLGCIRAKAMFDRDVSKMFIPSSAWEPDTNIDLSTLDAIVLGKLPSLKVARWIFQYRAEFGIPIVYDRNDLWSSNGDRRMETYIINNVDVVLCSSLVLLRDTKKHWPYAKVVYCPNGGEILNLPEVPKKKIAVYSGIVAEKGNIDQFRYIQEHNPGWKFMLLEKSKFSPDEEAKMKILADMGWTVRLHPPKDEYFKILNECSLGLNLFYGNGLWTDGMLTLKTFDYINAGLPILSSNCESVENDPVVNPVVYDFWEYAENLDAIPIPSRDTCKKILNEYCWNNTYHILMEELMNTINSYKEVL